MTARRAALVGWTLVACSLAAGCGFRVASTAGGDGGPGADADGDALIDGPPFVGTSPRKLVFDNRASTRDLDNFPVMVALTPSTIDYAQVVDPTVHLRFEDESGTTSLPFEVERWTPGGESILWVRVPRINSGSADDYVLMHFGPTESGLHDPSAVWSSYELVAHLGASLGDSTGNGHDGSGPAQVAPGQAGDAHRFLGNTAITNQLVTFANTGGVLDGWSAFSFELWIYADYASAMDLVGEPEVISKYQPLNNGRFFRSGNTLTFQVDVTFDSYGATYRNTSIPLRTWTHVVYTYDGTNLRLFRNGSQASMETVDGDPLMSSSNALVLGGNNSLLGALDELRVSNVNRNRDWLEAQYLSMTRQYVTFTDP